MCGKSMDIYILEADETMCPASRFLRSPTKATHSTLILSTNESVRIRNQKYTNLLAIALICSHRPEWKMNLTHLSSQSKSENTFLDFITILEQIEVFGAHLHRS